MEEIMEFTLTTTDIVAWWGAVIATFVFSWDVYKWLHAGPKLRTSVRSNMKTLGIPDRDDKTQIIVTVVNIGDRATTLTGIGLIHYKNKFLKLFDKREASFVIGSPGLTLPIPYVLEPGSEWGGSITQTEDIEAMAKDGILICEVYDSWHKNSFKNRVIIRNKS